MEYDTYPLLACRCEFYLGYTEAELMGKSWYEFITTDTLQSAAARHFEGR